MLPPVIRRYRLLRFVTDKLCSWQKGSSFNPYSAPSLHRVSAGKGWGYRANRDALVAPSDRMVNGRFHSVNNQSPRLGATPYRVYAGRQARQR